MPKEPAEFSTEVIREAAAGDANAHARILSGVRRFVRMVARDHLDDRLRPTYTTSDLESEVLAKVTPEKLGRVESVEHLRNLLREIAAKKGIDLRRRLERDPQFAADPIDAEPPHPSREIDIAFEGLRITPRRVAELIYAGNKAKDIQERLGITPTEYDAALGEIARELLPLVDPSASAAGGADGGA